MARAIAKPIADCRAIDDGFRFALPILEVPYRSFPLCRDRQHADDLVAAHHHHLVHHVDDDADVVGHDAHDVADVGPRVAAREIEEAVLLGEARDLRLGMFEDQAVTVEPAAGVRGQRLGAGIEDAALRARRG